MSLRVAFYSHNGFGLGHLRRNLLLAEGILGQRPNADVLIITGSAGLAQFPLPPAIDVIKLPSVRKQATGRWRPHALDIEMEHLLRLRTSMVLEAIRAYRPHLFVADFLPLGVEGELRPTLEELAARPDARSVIGFRDILDDAETVRRTWELDGSDVAIRELYDLVLVYGEREWFDFTAYGLPSDMPAYTGLLGAPEAVHKSRPRGDVRLLATCGGGADGYPVLASALESMGPLRARLEATISCTALTGPLMAEPDVSRLRGIGKRMGGRVHRFADDMGGKLARCSAVVAMGGYNTVCDALSYHLPAVIVPRSDPSREQQIRGKILADRGLARTVPLADCTAENLAQAIAEALDTPYPVDCLPRLDGVRAATKTLLDLMA